MSRARARNLVMVLVTLIVLVALFFLLRPESSAPQSSDVGETQEQPVALAINGNTMSPDEVSVTAGDQVTLHITSDHPVVLHMRGYDLEEEIEPGVPGSFLLRQR